MSIKQRVHQLLEPGDEGDRASRLVSGGLLLLIALNVTAMVLGTVPSMYAAAPVVFRRFEAISMVIFTVEYALRVWSCTASPCFAGPLTGRLRFMTTPLALIDLLAVLPFWLPALGVDLRVMRAVRLSRAFRLLKLGRYSTIMQTIGRVLTRKHPDLLTSLLMMGLLLLLAATLVYYAEHHAQPALFSSIPATMWWGITTLTTVGYGDMYPITTLGRMLGAVVMILGIGMFALPAGILGAAFVDDLKRHQPKPTSKQTPRHISIRSCPHCGARIDYLFRPEERDPTTEPGPCPTPLP